MRSKSPPYLFLGTGMWEEGRGPLRPCAALRPWAGSACFPGFLRSKCTKPPGDCPFAAGQWVGLALFKMPEEPESLWSPGRVWK